MKVIYNSILIEIDGSEHTALIENKKCEVEYSFPFWGFDDVHFHFKEINSRQYLLTEVEPYDGLECLDCTITAWYLYIQKLTTEKMPLGRIGRAI